ncbi:MAG: hypothetical protein AB8G23_13245 [Myxococcota bacterium]
MKKMMILLAASMLVFSVACSGDDAKDAANSAANSATDAANNAGNAASDMMNKAGNAAGDAAKAATDSAHGMVDSAKDAAAGMAGSAVASCRSMAEAGNYGAALEVCKKAHEMMPDDLALEHAYQQAQAAAGN